MRTPIYQSELGRLLQGDCISLMKEMPDRSVDLIFADPPFNIGKVYKSGIDDNLLAADYIAWTESWIKEAVRILKNGGTMFVYNIPKWNIESASILNGLGMNFRHWIAVEMTNGMPIKGRLYPAHYSLLYYTKGQPRVFAPPRTVIEKCRHCDGDLKDYGGHRSKLNPSGLNLKDIWTDIGKVSGRKTRAANELPLKLIDRCLDIGSLPGDLVFDPFAGSGTTAVVSELTGRRWLSAELDDCQDAITRLSDLSVDRELLLKIYSNKNKLE